MVDTTAFTGIVFSWGKSSLFWVIVIFAVAIGGMGGLYMRKRRKLEYPVVIYTGLGNGKFTQRSSRAGWFKIKSTFFGLIDYGPETVLKLADGRKILAGSLEDMQEINGRMGFAVYRKEDDPKIVVPINRLDVTNKGLISRIAPADYRDAASDIIDSAIKETQSGLDKYLPVIIYGSIVVMSLIIILLIIQFANSHIDKAGDILEKVAYAMNVRPSQIMNGTVAP